MAYRVRMTLRCFLLTAAGLLPASSPAHVIFAEPHASAGAYYAGFFRISHGCGDSDTVAVRISIPESVLSARPQPKPGWTVSIDRVPLAQPAMGEGGTVMRDRVASITWKGRLPSDQFDQFGVMMKLPDRAGPLYFPVVQTCVSGENDWVSIPKAGQEWHAVPYPAPVIELTGTDDGMHMQH